MAFEINRGMNIGGWLGSKGRRDVTKRRAFFGRDDVQRLADFGFDHLRLPVDEELLWDDAGGHIPEAWEDMNAALDWAAEAGLRVVVDLHILRSHFFNAPERPLFTDPDAPGRFGELWRELSAELRERPNDSVAYELLNEAVADDHADWNRVYPCAYRAIRDAEPERTVVLGSNLWNQARTFEFLDVPTGDRNLVLTFHFYNPMHVSHYGASFVKACAAYDGPIRYPGVPIPQEVFNGLPAELQSLVAEGNVHYDASVMEGNLLWPLAVAARTGLPLYCGEFGVRRNTPADIRARWLSDLVGVLEGHDIPWAVWTYRGSFGLFDDEKRPDECVKRIVAR